MDNRKQKLAIVAGAGPGLGQALVSHLNENGYIAFGLSRTLKGLDPDTSLKCDLTDVGEIKSALKNIICTHGKPDLVIHNATSLVIKPFLETTLDDFEKSWKSIVLSAFNISQVIMPMLVAEGKGTLLFAGATASLRGGKNFTAFSSAKSGLRALSQSLAREFGPQGVHVAHIILDGLLGTQKSFDLHKVDPEKTMNLKEVSEVFLSIAKQPSTAWSQEIDLRPSGEAF